MPLIVLRRLAFLGAFLASACAAPAEKPVFETPLLTKGGITDNEKVKSQIIALHPMKRFGKSEEIAKGFIFLATDDSAFVTGSTLEVDGGYLAQ